MNKKINMIVESVIENSIADELEIKSGDKILSINNQTPKDIIEYSFLINDEEINLLVEHKNGELWSGRHWCYGCIKHAKANAC